MRVQDGESLLDKLLRDGGFQIRALPTPLSCRQIFENTQVTITASALHSITLLASMKIHNNF
jgi:hypothetical protein